LARPAYAACFVEAAEACIDRTLPDGTIIRGAFHPLETYFGRGAFDEEGSRRFEACAYSQSTMKSADGFIDAWVLSRDKAVRHPDRRGPLDVHFTAAGGDRPAGQRMQRALSWGPRRSRRRFSCPAG
jgi:hypothetical protein